MYEKLRKTTCEAESGSGPRIPMDGSGAGTLQRVLL